MLASDLAAMAGRVCATDLSLFRADADLRVALYCLGYVLFISF